MSYLAISPLGCDGEVQETRTSLSETSVALMFRTVDGDPYSRVVTAWEEGIDAPLGNGPYFLSPVLKATVGWSVRLSVNSFFSFLSLPRLPSIHISLSPSSSN